MQFSDATTRKFFGSNTNAMLGQLAKNQEKPEEKEVKNGLILIESDHPSAMELYKEFEQQQMMSSQIIWKKYFQSLACKSEKETYALLPEKAQSNCPQQRVLLSKLLTNL